MSNHDMKRLHDAVEASILPGGYLILGIVEDVKNADIIATVGKIGQLGEWHGVGKTEAEALQNAVNVAENES